MAAAQLSTTEKDIAVLQTEIKYINDSIDELKISVKEVHDCIHKNSVETHLLLKDLSEAGDKAHLALSSKISSLEKWRWTMMGAGLVVGSLGFDAIAKLLK